MKKILNNIKYLTITIFTVGVLSVSSCSEWLNVQPSNQTSADELFKTEAGFQEALSGVYTLMTKEEAYGKEMTYGFADVVAQQWDLSKLNTSSSTPYYGAKTYDFETEITYSLIENIWLTQYTAIANANDILAFVDDRKSVFDGIGYSIVKGEALALRAFLHFDLLRLFAPNDFALGTETKYIPYVSEYSKNLTLSHTAKEVYNKCLADLEEAAKLLKVDPLLTGEKPTDPYYDSRITHLNYYAVKALMARIYLYAGKKPEALACANEVIDAQTATRFRWVKEAETTSTSDKEMDYTYSAEHLFHLNVRKLEDYAKSSFGGEATVVLNNRKYNSETDELFRGTTDYRTYLYSASDKSVIKFKQVKDSETRDIMPMIKIPEMYYIAAECSADATEALGYLNTVRRNRRIVGDITDINLFESELFKEYQKEFVGEGQLFYYYKRLNQRIETVGDNYTFVLPLPRVEIDLGGRPRPASNN